jgi:hypothetical protein
MEAIINLLKDKNYHLLKFFQLNETELMNFVDGNFDNLEVFYQSRETILDLIRCIDQLIEAATNAQEQSVQMPDELKGEVLAAMSQKNDLVTRILAQDLQILSVIEQTKSSIIKELRQVQSARKAVGAYKTNDTVSNFDEEA